MRHYSGSRNMPRRPSCKGRAARGIEHVPRCSNPAYSAVVQSLEKGHLVIVGFESSDSTFVRFDLVEGRLLDLKIGVKVDLCRLDRPVAEPESDHAASSARLEQLHGHRVPEHMRGHMFVAQRRATLAGAFDMPGQQMPYAVRAEASRTRAGKDDRIFVSSRLAQPSTQCIGSRSGQRGRSLLAALAHTIVMISPLGQVDDEKIRLSIVARECCKPQPSRRAACLGRASPFHSLGRREQYLRRYTHRTAIGNERVRAIGPTEVAFTVRADEHGGKHRIWLKGEEFIGRLMLHVLPTGIKRIRHYGVLACACKGAKLDAARKACGHAAAMPAGAGVGHRLHGTGGAHRCAAVSMLPARAAALRGNADWPAPTSGAGQRDGTTGQSGAAMNAGSGLGIAVGSRAPPGRGGQCASMPGRHLVPTACGAGRGHTNGGQPPDDRKKVPPTHQVRQ